MTRLSLKQKDYILFCISGAFLGIYTGLYEPTFNNYLAETFNISEATRGGIEFFRESPAVFVVLLSGILMSLADIRIAIISLLILSLGLLGQGFIAPTLQMAIVWMVIWSVGAHLCMPISSSIVVGLSEPHEVGRKLGKWSGINAAASLIGYLAAWLGFRYFHINFSLTFGLAALAVIAAVICMLFMDTQKVSRAGTKIVFKKKYSLYYLLSLIFGARKQIFLTFGPWVLIKEYHQAVTTFALLGIVGTVLGIFFKPALGAAIDRYGERIIIMFESAALVVVCLGYGFANSLFPTAIAVIVVYTCFVGDNLLFACTMARTTYLNKIVESKSDLTPTLSMGISIDHVVSMTVPFFAGLLWEQMGFKYVFLMAALLAVANFWAAKYIRTNKETLAEA